MEPTQHLAGAGDGVLGAFDLDLVAARADVDPQAVLDLDEVGVELAEQRAQHARFVELDLGPGAARRFLAEMRRFVGALRFAGHAGFWALLSLKSAGSKIGAGCVGAITWDDRGASCPQPASDRRRRSATRRWDPKPLKADP